MKNIFKSSLSKKLILYFLIVIITIASINLWVSFKSVKLVKKEVLDSYSNSLHLLSEELTNILLDKETVANLLVNDQDILALNQSPPDKVSWEYMEVYKKLQFIQDTTALKSHIMVFLFNKQSLFSSIYGTSYIDNGYNFDSFFLNAQNSQWIYRYSSIENNYVLSYYKSPFYNKENGVLTYIEININEIQRILGNLTIQDNGTIFLTDEKGFSVFSKQQIPIDTERVLNSIKKSNKDNGIIDHEYNYNRLKIIYKKMPTTNLTLAMALPVENIMKPIKQTQFLIAIIVIFSIFLAVAFTLVSYKQILHPINQLVEGMREASLGNFKIQLKHNYKHETGFMLDQFNLMVKEIDTLVKEVYENKSNYHQSQLKLLQSQINPHFLYNCLNFIYQMCVLEETEGASKMSLYLGKYFRFATKSDQNLVTLKEELDNIHSYIKIQQMRYPGKINYSIKLDEKIQNTVIPRLIVQPLVENAIIHGMETLIDSANIYIHAYLDNNTIIVVVEDDGIGITKEKAEEINKTLDEMKLDKSGHALNNTHWRLRLKFGENSGLYLLPRKPKGTIAKITIPLEKRSVE